MMTHHHHHCCFETFLPYDIFENCLRYYLSPMDKVMLGIATMQGRYGILIPRKYINGWKEAIFKRLMRAYWKDTEQFLQGRSMSLSLLHYLIVHLRYKLTNFSKRKLKDFKLWHETPQDIERCMQILHAQHPNEPYTYCDLDNQIYALAEHALFQSAAAIQRHRNHYFALKYSLHPIHNEDLINLLFDMYYTDIAQNKPLFYYTLEEHAALTDSVLGLAFTEDRLHLERINWIQLYHVFKNTGIDRLKNVCKDIAV
jgi:hypothetical protein